VSTSFRHPPPALWLWKHFVFFFFLGASLTDDDARLLSKRVIKSFPSNWLLSVLWFYLYCLLIHKMASFEYQCTLNQLLVKTAEESTCSNPVSSTPIRASRLLRCRVSTFPRPQGWRALISSLYTIVIKNVLYDINHSYVHICS
jgi:hypothetical protein